MWTPSVQVSAPVWYASNAAAVPVRVSATVNDFVSPGAIYSVDGLTTAVNPVIGVTDEV